MDIKLKFTGICLFACLVSCSAKKENTSREEDYTIAYKESVLCGCMDAVTNKQFSRFLYNSNDAGLSVAVAVLDHAETEEAQNLGAEYSKHIKPIAYADAEGRSPYFHRCIAYAFSNEVDSIARERFERLIATKEKE